MEDWICYLITGKAGTGKTTLLQLLLHGARALGGNCCVADFGSGRLQKAAAQEQAEWIHDTDTLFSYTQRLQAEFLLRNKEKQALVRDGAEEAEIFDAMRQKHAPLFLLIDDLNAFI